MSWILPAMLSAIFAAMTAILAKIGIKDINSNLATAIRTVVILIFAWGIVFEQGVHTGLQNIRVFTYISGIIRHHHETFMAFLLRALQLGTASQVAPIDKLSLVFTIIFAGLFLNEKVTWVTIVGGSLMALGAYLIIIVK